MKESIVLAVESSCDETAVAILKDSPSEVRVLSSVISSQIDLHAEWGGVVPELASRNHLLKLKPLVDQALSEASITIDQVSFFAATNGPGLASSLLIGSTMTKAMAMAAGKPFLAINHMEGHLVSPFFHDNKLELEPHVSLIISGGHTMLLDVTGIGQYQLLGKTLDDAAGEAFDKVAKMLSLPYPGGPIIERLAAQGDPKRFKFPRSMVKKNNLDFSFSGLKTAVLYELKALAPDTGLPDQTDIPDICASFQQAVIDVLIKKSIIATSLSDKKVLTLSGGVSCNETLRAQMKEACSQSKIDVLYCSKHLSTDNAVMIGLAAILRRRQGESHSISIDINPNLSLTS